jgi:hypothetical protein
MAAKGSRLLPSCHFCKISEQTNATQHCTYVTRQINMFETTLFAVSLFLFVTNLTALSVSQRPMIRW